MDLRSLRFVDHPKNPLIEPPAREYGWQHIIADPAVVTPRDAPDRKWHLFAHSLAGIHHYLSEDGIDWRKSGGVLFAGLRPFVVAEDGFVMFYERYRSPLRSHICLRRSRDLATWGEEHNVLTPAWGWEGRGMFTNSNPCVVRHRHLWRLYFSASWVWLKNCGFIEPRYIGYAESGNLEGPYEKSPEPLIVPSPDVPWRNHGAGSIKVIAPTKRGEPWFALNNGIFIDARGKNRSEIHLLESDDGLAWRECFPEPILAPESQGWKRALVYAMCLVEHEGETRIYYNARDGWMFGRERIGVAIGQPRG